MVFIEDSNDEVENGERCTLYSERERLKRKKERELLHKEA